MPDAYRLFHVQVRAVRDLSPHLRRVTFGGEDLDEVAPTTLDRRIKLLLPPEGEESVELPRDSTWYEVWRSLPAEARPALRTYTARAVRPSQREVDVDLVLHGDAGPASRWAQDARPGQRLVLVLPVAGVADDRVGIAWHPGNATQLLLAGDETALPAIAGIVESLSPDVTGQVIVEVPTSTDLPQLATPARMTVTALARDGQPHGHLLTEAVLSACWSPGAVDRCDDACASPDVETEPEPDLVWDEPQDVTADHYAWLAGEAGVITNLRRHLVCERGWPRDRVAFMGYWRAGRAEI